MSLIEDLKKLEKAGKNYADNISELHESVCVVADKICRVIPDELLGKPLPRGYKVDKVQSNVGSCIFLFSGNRAIDFKGGYLHGDLNIKIEGRTRETSLQFAKDVSEGLLEEIRELLNSEREEMEKATKLLDEVPLDSI